MNAPDKLDNSVELDNSDNPNDTDKRENVGKWTHRYEREPIEEMFAKEWDKKNRDDNTLEYLLSDTINERMFVEDHDREVVATMMQWLGSHCGLCFLRDALKLNELEGWNKHVRELSNEDH